MRAFALKHEYFYTSFNHGKSGKQRKRNKRLGKKQMRNRLKRLDSRRQQEAFVSGEER
jgi:hypothetical protein